MTNLFMRHLGTEDFGVSDKNEISVIVNPFPSQQNCAKTDPVHQGIFSGDILS